MSVLSGCGGGDGDDAPFTAAGSDSPYCKTYRAWKVYELDHGEAFDQPTPAALRRFWNVYLRSEETMLRQAPPEIRTDVMVKVRFIRTRLAPTLVRYAFDLKRLERQGTATERATVFRAPPADVQQAQEAQYAYENRNCGTAPSPPPADVDFEDDGSSRSFCAALRAFDIEADEVASSRFDADVMRAFVTGERFSAILDRLDDTAPAAIADDVRADTEWFRTRWSDVVARYGYDLRRIYLHATSEDLAVFNRTHPAVVEHTSRETAFDAQVCGG